MLSNLRLKSGCVYDAATHAAVQERFSNLDSVGSHLDIALASFGRKGVDVSIDPDAFVLLEQIRFAYLVVSSIPEELRRGLEEDWRLTISTVRWTYNGMTAVLLKEGRPYGSDRKREVLQTLREFDCLWLRHPDLVEPYFHHVEEAMRVADSYREFELLSRLYRLQLLHPCDEVRSKVKTLLYRFLRPRLNYVGPGSTLSTPEQLDETLRAWQEGGSESKKGYPASLEPLVLDGWVRLYERDLLRVVPS